MKKLTLTYFLLCLVSVKLCAQKIEVKSTKFDSVKFSLIRKELNSLNTEAFTKKVFEANGTKLPYRLLAPKNQKSGTKYPLIIALHNSSRLGTNNESQLEPLTRTWLREQMRDQFPAFVLAPQFETRPTIYAEHDKLKILTATPQANLQILLRLIDSFKENPSVDTKRIYLIGYSMGGSTAQHLMSAKPDWFAAMIAVAGVPDISNLQNIKHKPIWLIHGRKDDENPFNGSKKLFEQLKENKKARFTIYESLDHNNITLPLLATNELAKWLFKWKI